MNERLIPIGSTDGARTARGNRTARFFGLTTTGSNGNNLQVFSVSIDSVSIYFHFISYPPYKHHSNKRKQLNTRNFPVLGNLNM